MWNSCYGVSERIATDRLKSLIGAEWHGQLTFSKFFLGDYLLAPLALATFLAMRRAGRAAGAALLLAIEQPVRCLAAYTLTLCLLHQLLFVFWAAVIRGDPQGYGYGLSAMAMVRFSVMGIGHLTENKRHDLRKRLEVQLPETPRSLSRLT